MSEHDVIPISSPTTMLDWANQLVRRLDRRSTLWFLGYLALCVIEIAGLVTPRYPDSAYFTQLNFFGRDEMLPTVPLIYTLAVSDPVRIAVQTIFAGISWWVLAKVASDLVSDRRVRLGLRLVLLALGVVGPIAQWNSVVLSESIAMSLTVLLFAAWIRYQQRPSTRSATAAIVVTVLWTFSRQALVSLSVPIALLALINVAMHRRELLRYVVAGLLVLNSVLGFAVLNQNRHFSMTVESDIIEDRILVNPSYTNWYVAHGMPYSSAIQATAGGDYGLALQAMPQMVNWIEADGTRTYIEFMIEHPVYTFIDPLPYFSGERTSLHNPPSAVYPSTQPDPTPSLISPDANWARYRAVLPDVLQSVLFQQGSFADVLALLGVAVGFLVVARRYRRGDHRLWVPAMLAVSVIPQVYLTQLTGGVGELDRLALVEAVCVRISLWVILAYALDRYLAGRAAARRDEVVVTEELASSL